MIKQSGMVVAGFGALALTLSAYGAVAQDKIVVGAAVAKTGWLAPYDSVVMDGFEVAMDEINKNGGIAGKYMIELIVQDNRSDNAQNAIITQELIDQGADFLIVACDSSMVHATAQILVDAQIPAISSCSSSPTLPLTGEGFIFANAPADNMQGAVQAIYARDQGYQTVYLLKSPDIEYTLMPDYFGATFEKLGGTVVGEGVYSLGQPDFSSEVTKIKSLDPQPDVIMTAAFEPDFPAFIRALRAAGVTIPVIAGDGIDSPTTFALGDVVNGVVFTTSGFLEPGTALAAFNEKYKAFHGSESETIINALGWDLAKVLEAAVTAADSTDGIAVRDAIAGLDKVAGSMGEITFKGTNGTPLRPVVLIKIVDGERSFVSRTIPDADLIPAPKF
jgi:branched-chain amino acid transport system substrate-binding protein